MRKLLAILSLMCALTITAHAQSTTGTLQMAGNQWPAHGSLSNFDVENMPVMLSNGALVHLSLRVTKSFNGQAYVTSYAASVVDINGDPAETLITGTPVWSPTASGGTFSIDLTGFAALTAGSEEESMYKFAINVTYLIVKGCPRCNTQTSVTGTTGAYTITN
jgi:hypothetical protein